MIQHKKLYKSLQHYIKRYNMIKHTSCTQFLETKIVQHLTQLHTTHTELQTNLQNNFTNLYKT